MSEWSAQVAIFVWAGCQRKQYPELELLNSSLNGVRLTPGQARKAKMGGMKKGFPDLFLPVARGGYHGLFLELKVGKNYCTKEQKEWLAALRKQGYYADMVRGSEVAVKVIKEYLEGCYEKKE